MTNQGRIDSNAAPTTLGATRTVTIPEWMAVKASGAAAGARESLPLVASGALPSGQFGIVAYDVRDHLLLDPDRLDALVAMVDLARELVAPAELQIVSTGTFLALPAAADAKVVAPGGSIIAASRDKWGRLRIRPLLPGDYSVESANQKTDVYANYYDAGESDLIALATPSTPTTTSATEAQSATAPKQVQPMAALLIVFAVIAILLESALLLRTANRWGMRHV